MQDDDDDDGPDASVDEGVDDSADAEDDDVYQKQGGDPSVFLLQLEAAVLVDLPCRSPGQKLS